MLDLGSRVGRAAIDSGLGGSRVASADPSAGHGYLGMRAGPAITGLPPVPGVQLLVSGGLLVAAARPPTTRSREER